MLIDKKVVGLISLLLQLVGYILLFVTTLMPDEDDNLETLIFYILIPFLSAGTLGAQTVIQSVITEQYPGKIIESNGAFRMWFAIGILVMSLLVVVPVSVVK